MVVARERDQRKGTPLGTVDPDRGALHATGKKLAATGCDRHAHTWQHPTQPQSRHSVGPPALRQQRDFEPVRPVNRLEDVGPEDINTPQRQTIDGQGKAHLFQYFHILSVRSTQARTRVPSESKRTHSCCSSSMTPRNLKEPQRKSR